jgi:hypothetical protein
LASDGNRIDKRTKADALYYACDVDFTQHSHREV